MNKNVYRSMAGTLILSALLLLWPAVTLAQSGAGYELSWWTVDSGGSRVESGAPGPYTLDGAIGQPDAAVWQGATYTLAGGFWSGATVEFSIYLPLVLKHWEGI